MNRKVGKSPFILRTIAALILIYCTVMFGITVICAVDYQEKVFDTVRKQAEEMAADLRTCTGANPESAESRDGFQVAQAAAVMRYHLFVKKPELKKMGMEFDASFYKTVKDGEGDIRSVKEVRPQTPVLLSSPFSKNGKIIVFADTFSKAQMAQLEQVLENGDLYTYMEDVKGYDDGRFFLPTEITVGASADGKNEITIRTDYRDKEKKEVTRSFQDIQVVGPGNRIAGVQDGENSPKNTIRETYEAGDHLYGSSTRRGWTKAALYGNIFSQSQNYVLKYGVEMNPLAYTASHFKSIYLMSAVVFLILGGILAGGHNKVLEQRFENEESRRRMMDAMAHELKTPLGILKNYGEMLLEEEEGEKGRLYAQTIIEEAEGMNRVVVSMLDLSKMEAGTYPMELSSLSVTELAKKEAKRMDILRREKNLRLDLRLEKTPRILADEKLVLNILSNFMSNAICHAEENSRITVEVKPEKTGAYISVHNQGQPVSAKDMKKIWNSFYRSDSGRSRKDGGSGLGLAIVRNACILHGGTCGCSNEKDGVTFWAKIPSMEKGLGKAALQTGPVLNVTGNGYRLRGLLPVAVGMTLQGIFSYSMYMGTFSHLFRGDYFNILPLSMVEICGALAGWLLVLAGLLRIHRSGLNMKPMLITVTAVCLLAVLSGAEILRSWKTDTVIEEPTLFLSFCEALMYLTAVAVNALLFWKFRKLAQACEDKNLVRKLSWKFCAYMMSCTLYVVLSATGLIWVMTGYLIIFPFWLVVSIFAAYGWLQVYRRLNGREPLE